MFKRAEKEPLQIGKPKLIHTTYSDQDIIPKWQGLTASAAPSEYFNRPVKDKADDSLQSRGLDNRKLASDISQAFRPPEKAMSQIESLSSVPQLPNPLASHRIPPSTVPEEPSETPKHSGAHKSRKPRISLLQTQVLKLRAPFEPSAQPAEEKSRRKSGSMLTPIKTGANGKRTSSAPQQEGTTTNDEEEDTPRKASWAERAARMRKDAHEHRTRSPKLDIKQKRREATVAQALDSRPSTASDAGPSPVSAIGGRFEEGLETSSRKDSTLDNEDDSPLVTPVSVTFEDAQKVQRKPVGNRNSLIKRLSMLGRKDRNDQDAHLQDLPHTLPSIIDASPSTSRFSWTTVNTITTVPPDSPPLSPVLEPRSSQEGKEAAEQEVVVVVPPTPPMSQNEDEVTLKKPALAEKPLPDLPSEEAEGEQPSALQSEQTSDSLPEAQPMSRMDSFMAKELELRARRHEIESAIRKLMKVERASPLEVDWKTRRTNKRELDISRKQLAEVEREQHEVGLAIARARVREANDSGMEPTLWVRRATWLI